MGVIELGGTPRRVGRRRERPIPDAPLAPVTSIRHRVPHEKAPAVVQRPSSIHIDIVGEDITIPPINIEQHHAIAMCAALLEFAVYCLEKHTGGA